MYLVVANFRTTQDTTLIEAEVPVSLSALVRLLHIITTSHPVSGVFFCFPVSAISVFEVSCHRSPHCSCYSVAKTHYTATGAQYRPRDERESVFIAQLLVCVGELMSKRLAADVACLPNVL